MQIIKKYANRKLYHTNRKQYITLDGIAELIHAGQQVQVIDNETGEDITAPIMSQVVLQARGRTSLLPTNVLTSLLQTSGDTLTGVRRAVWAALGRENTADAAIARRLQALHAQGAIDSVELARLQTLLITNEPPEAAPDLLAAVPHASDVARLAAQVDALTDVVEQMLRERQHGEG